MSSRLGQRLGSMFVMVWDHARAELSLWCTHGDLSVQLVELGRCGHSFPISGLETIPVVAHSRNIHPIDVRRQRGNTVKGWKRGLVRRVTTEDWTGSGEWGGRAVSESLFSERKDDPRRPIVWRSSRYGRIDSFDTRERRGTGARRPRNFRVVLQDRTGHPVQRNKSKGQTKSDETKEASPGIPVKFSTLVHPKDQVNVGASPVRLVEDHFIVPLSSPITLLDAKIQVVLMGRGC